MRAHYGLLLSLLIPLPSMAGQARSEAIPTGSRQLIMVIAESWDSPNARMQTFERKHGQWKALAAPTPVMIGKNGMGWGSGLHPHQLQGPQKAEGDGKAPAGIFAIGPAFGYSPALSTGLPYLAMSADDWCVDVNESPLYNRIVSTKDVGLSAIEGSSEPMRRDIHSQGDMLYAKGFVIQHNPENTPRLGSCIFAHLWRSPVSATAGCTAMPEPVMHDLLAWLDSQKQPVFVSLPLAEYHRLRPDWRLPTWKN